MLENIFGMNSAPFKKYMRMVYWMPKFKNKDPWPVPFNLPDETLELAKLAIERITSVDKTTEIAVYDTDDIAESIDATWIVSGQSSVQRDMIRYANEFVGGHPNLGCHILPLKVASFPPSY